MPLTHRPKSFAPSYRSHGCQISRIGRQDDTDFEKCTTFIESDLRAGATMSTDILVLGSFGGRLDHTGAIIDTMVRWNSSFRELLVVGDACDALLLPPGHHRVIFDDTVQSRVCGLLPFGRSPARVITRGFRWELDHTSPHLHFGGLISSSNERIGEEAEISTDQCLLLTSTIASDSFE